MSKKGTAIALLGWSLWVGQLGGSWTKDPRAFETWAACDQAGQQARQTMGQASIFVGGMVSRPAPYACSQPRQIELEKEQRSSNS